MTRVLFLSLLLVVAGCGSSTAQPERGQTDGETPTPAVAADPYGDPPAYGGDPFAGFGEIVTIAVPGGVSEADVNDTADRAGMFSVQVAACASQEAAEGVAGDLRGLLEQQVFIDVEGAYHKVRVGSFGSREQAAALQASIRALGYADAWIVER